MEHGAHKKGKGVSLKGAKTPGGKHSMQNSPVIRKEGK